ncbi:reverse transcriptase domain-containing protein [Methylobacterium sp. SD21]|uniref:reverse transcriptase domain-containing protein n=1 Tax=Methylobacterium litchii TaxID=3138810 RepID=UPI00313C2CE3
MAGNDERRVRGLIIRLLNSFHAKLAAVEAANRRLQPVARLPKDQLFELAQTLNLWSSSSEKATIRSIPKPRGGHRYVVAFGIENRARQILVSWALKPWILPKLLHQQNALNGGRDKAIQKFAQTIEERRHTYAVELDVQNCFGSIRVDWLKEHLPLPPEVTQAVCAADQINLIALDIHAGTCPTSRQGLPQGSAVSPIIAEYVLACVLKEVPEGVAFEAYVDNIFVSAPDEIGARQHQQTLERLFEAHPAGLLRVHSTGPQGIRNGLPALGYVLRLVRRRVRIEIGYGREEDILHKIEALWDRGDISSEERKIRADRIISGWCAAHALWKGVRRFDRNIREHIRYLVPQCQTNF